MGRWTRVSSRHQFGLNSVSYSFFAEVPTVDAGESNNILFVGNLPDGATAEMLEVLFKQIKGFKEVRQVTGRPDIAFIE